MPPVLLTDTVNNYSLPSFSQSQPLVPSWSTLTHKLFVWTNYEKLIVTARLAFSENPGQALGLGAPRISSS